MFDRREFLKLFGVGATVVPIIGGIPVAMAEAKLIEIPKIVPVTKSSVNGFAASEGSVSFLTGPCGLTMVIDDVLSGKRTTFYGKTFVLSTSIESQRFGPSFRDEVQHKKTVWRMEGEMIPNDQGEIGTITTEFIR